MACTITPNNFEYKEFKQFARTLHTTVLDVRILHMPNRMINDLIQS